MNTRQLFAKLALVFILLYAQYGSNVHASVHDFHEHSHYCEIYDSKGNPEYALPATFTLVTLSFDPIQNTTVPYILGTFYRPIPQSRGPPFIS